VSRKLTARENRAAAAGYLWARRERKPRRGCGFQFSRKTLLIHMTAGLSQQDLRSRFRRLRNFAEETPSVRQFMDHGEGESQIDLSRKVVNTQGSRRSNASVDAAREIRFLRAAFQAGDHLRLQIDSDYAARRANQSRQRNREKSHAGAGFKNSHAFVHVRAEDMQGILSHPAA